MKYHRGLWYCHGRQYATLRAALEAAWLKGGCARG